MPGEAAVGGGGEVEFAYGPEHFAQGGDEFLRLLKHIEVNVVDGEVFGVALLQQVVDVAGEIRELVFDFAASLTQVVDGLGILDVDCNNGLAVVGEVGNYCRHAPCTPRLCGADSKSSRRPCCCSGGTMCASRKPFRG